MKPNRQTRTLTAWALYASVLFSLMLCGLHHGQMSGLSLSGLQGGFCALDSSHGPSAIDLAPSGSDQHMAQLDCPVCSSFALAVPLASHGWTPLPAHGKAPGPIVARSRAQPPPRYLRHSIIPRAPPLRFPAAHTLA